ncbi:MAG: 1-(5-phosphoribosyl)-5-[(5-phosphoribosylamino)methylideneamino]imidazole-4-carboxamide isomerase [Anaerolineaceae bacterium]|nr:1-(5-phosphoribosyl)-5-[(5-phosphoribosylamino)methylideneamino]imidazole-4-carboxamide isomerase [Anaerolineaceae bacterium]
MSSFTIYPAIDLMNGNVVRLKQGDPKEKTIYSTDPELVARNWISQGATWLHIVNLDGAFKDQENNNLAAIKKILSLTKNDQIKIQLGGGLRSLEMIEKTLDLGVSRVILGTIAVENIDLLKIAIKEFGEQRIVVGIDAWEGMVRTHGWTINQTISALTLSLQIKQLGIKTIIYTDINRDGVGGGVNLDSTSQLAQKSGLEVIASGGIYSKSDIMAVKSAKLPGVIVGRALYEGSVDPQSIFNLQEHK